MKKRYLAVLMSVALAVNSTVTGMAAAGDSTGGSWEIAEEKEDGSEERADEDGYEEDSEDREDLEAPGEEEGSEIPENAPEEGNENAPESGSAEDSAEDSVEDAGNEEEKAEDAGNEEEKTEEDGESEEEAEDGQKEETKEDSDREEIREDSGNKEPENEKLMTWTGFCPLEKTVYEFAEKPELEALLEEFPGSLKGILTDGDREWIGRADVEWECTVDYENSYLREYFFEAVPEPADFELGTELMPEITVRIHGEEKVVLRGEADGTTVTIEADSSVIPADGILLAERGSAARIPEEWREQSGEILSYRITVLDGEGNRIQPDPSKGKMRVSFRNKEWERSGLASGMKLYQLTDGRPAPVESSVLADGVECAPESLAQFILTAEPGKTAAAMIGDQTYATLKEAFDAVQPGEKKTIVLLSDVSCGETIAVKDGKHIVLDLNGHNAGFQKNALLGVKGGKLELTGKGRVYEEDPVYGVVQMVGTAEKTEDYSVLIVGEDVTLQGNYALLIFGVYAAGSGESTYANGVRLDIFGTIEGQNTRSGEPGVGIYVNGTIHPTGDLAPVINMYGSSKVSGPELGMYIAGFSRLTLMDQALTEGDETGIELRAGSLSLEDRAVIRGLGVPAFSEGNNNGSTTAGAGLAVTQHTTKQPIHISGSGGELCGYTPLYEANPQKNPQDAIDRVSLEVTGGSFRLINGGKNAVYSEDKEGFIAGGTYSERPETKYLAAGYTLKKTEDGRFEAISLEDAVFSVLADGEKTDDSNPVVLDLNLQAENGKNEVRLSVSDSFFGPYTWTVSDSTVAELDGNEGDSVILKGLKEGTVRVTVSAAGLGEEKTAAVNAVVTDSTKAAVSGSESSKVVADVEAGQVQTPAVEGSLTEQQKQELEAGKNQLVSDLKTDLENNKAVNSHPVETSENAAEKMAEAGLLSGGQKAVVSTQQILKEVRVDSRTEYSLDENGTIILDENGEKVVETVTPYISSVRYSIKPTYRLEDLAGNALAQ